MILAVFDPLGAALDSTLRPVECGPFVFAGLQRGEIIARDQEGTTFVLATSIPGGLWEVGGLPGMLVESVAFLPAPVPAEIDD